MATKKAAAYHGVEGVKFAPKTNGSYATEDGILSILYAKSLNPSSLLEAVEQYADDRLLFRVPNDKGYDVELGTTGQDPALEEAAGYVMAGSNGTISVGQVAYARGALYYEFLERDEEGVPSKVKVWMFNVEVGKGTGSFTTDESSVTFGTYTYPMRVYGDPLKSADGSADSLDAKGLGRTAFLYTCRPGDTGYETFGDSVPVPKIASGT